jgi:hypothetical protein
MVTITEHYVTNQIFVVFFSRQKEKMTREYLLFLNGSTALVGPGRFSFS